MQSGELRIDVNQLSGLASQWSGPCTELSVLAPLSPGHPFQPTTAAVGNLHAAVELLAAALNARTHATTSAVETGAVVYANNEATAAAAMAAVPQTRLV
jgi:hypothetical protein